MGIFIEQKHFNNSQVPVQQIELCSRPGVLAKNGFLTLEAEPKNFSKDMSQSCDIKNRFICIKTVPPVKKVHFWMTRSFQSGNGYRETELIKKSDVSFPSILNKIKWVLKSRVMMGQAKAMILIRPTWKGYSC